MNPPLLLFVAVVCIWLIRTPRVHTGVFGTAGLVLVACGCLAALDEGASADRAFTIRSWGLAAIGWGAVWRFLIRPKWLEWADNHDWFYHCARWAGIEKRAARRSPTSKGHR